MKLKEKTMHGRKKVLLISVAESWGGGEQFILDLCNNINHFDFRILSAKGKVSEIFEQNGLDIKEVRSLKKIERSGQKWRMLSILKIIFYLKLNLFLLSLEIIKYKPDLIISNGNMAGLYSYLPFLITRKKFIVVQHLIYQRPIEFKVVNQLIKHAELFVCVSNAVAENIKKIIRAKELLSKIKVIYNGINVPQELPAIKNKRDAKIMLGFVGALKEEKGFALLIDALKLIPQEFNYCLNVFGSYGNSEESQKFKAFINNNIQNFNLSEKIYFHEFSSDKNNIYDQIDILINYSSVPESFSYVILEGMAYGKIIIASDEGGPKEIVTDKVNGFLVEPRNPLSLSKTIIECISNFNTEKFDAVRLNAYKTALEKFCLDVFIKNYEELFDSLINKSIN
jgi:glycosyltransferase involved in cell wall biosynthesis